MQKLFHRIGIILKLCNWPELQNQTKIELFFGKCNLFGCFYQVQFAVCWLQFYKIRVRFRNHNPAMKTNKKTCEVAAHFNSTPHALFDFQFICIEKISQQANTESRLITREAYWTAQLGTLRPYGSNKR